MDIPLHPLVVAEIARGREFLEQIRAARRNIEQLRVTVSCPDGDNQIVFGGDGMVVDATFTDDVFARHPGAALSELLLAMAEEGYAQVSQKVSAQVSAIVEQR
jgi:DNA-binding protein YbaB